MSVKKKESVQRQRDKEKKGNLSLPFLWNKIERNFSLLPVLRDLSVSKEEENELIQEEEEGDRIDGRPRKKNTKNWIN